MIPILLIIFSLLLIVFSIIDIKSKAIPSILLTGTLFFLAFIRFDNIQWAILLGILGLLMWEFAESNEVSFGVADIKVMIMFGFFITSIYSMFGMMILFAVGQVFYIFGLKRYTKMKEVPFIPFFLAIWIAGFIGGLWA